MPHTLRLDPNIPPHSKLPASTKAGYALLGEGSWMILYLTPTNYQKGNHGQIIG